MKAIGVRELRQRASEFLQEVEAGRTIQVTAHGRPVAYLVPARSATRRQSLIARGHLVPGRGDVLDLGAPLRPSPAVAAASATLRRARANER